MNTNKSNKSCDVCTHHSTDICVDELGLPVVKYNGEAYVYEICNKNWGLPQQANLNGDKCKFFTRKK